MIVNVNTSGPPLPPMIVLYKFLAESGLHWKSTYGFAFFDELRLHSATYFASGRRAGT